MMTYQLLSLSLVQNGAALLLIRLALAEDVIDQSKQVVSNRNDRFLLTLRGEPPELPFEIAILLTGGGPGAIR